VHAGDPRWRGWTRRPLEWDRQDGMRVAFTRRL